MKILIVFNQPAPYKVNLFNELTKYFDLDVIFERETCSNRDPLFYSENKYKFNAIFLKFGAFGEEQSNTSELKTYIKNNHKKYSHIIMNGYSTLSEMQAIRYMIKNNIKYILMVNGGLIHNDSGIKRMLKKYLISHASYYLSPALLTDEYLIHYGANKEKIFNYPNSTIYDSEVVKGILSTDDLIKERTNLNLPTDKKIFICPSQFIPRKNNILLIKEIAKFKNSYLLLIGDGKEKDKYIKFIKDNHINNVLILPYKNRNDLFTYYKVSDAAITLSKEDIYGHTINEAMSQGLPVISSNKVVSASCLIENDKNGYIVSIDDIKSIDLAINSIDREMGKISIMISKENTIEKSAKIIETILRNLK